MAMAYDIIPIILIILSLAVIIVIILRRLPDLKVIDTSTIAEVRENQAKKKILLERLSRKTGELKLKFLPVLRKSLKSSDAFIKKMYGKILEMEKSYEKKEQTGQTVAVSESTVKLFEQAQNHLKNNDLDEAEKIYLEIIGRDSKNLSAYRGLGDIYIRKKDYGQAAETFRFLNSYLENFESLDEEKKQLRSASLFNLAEINFNLSNYKAAKGFLAKALHLDPHNPKYLDLMTEICIILKDKKAALNRLEQLKKSNPENEKINELASKIKEI